MMSNNRITLYQEGESIIDPKNPLKEVGQTISKTYACHVRVVNDIEEKLSTGIKTGKTIKVHIRGSVPEFDYAEFNGKRYEEVGRSYGFGRDITITMERRASVGGEGQ